MSMCFFAPVHLVIVKYKDAMPNTLKICMAVVVALLLLFLVALSATCQCIACNPLAQLLRQSLSPSSCLHL